MRPGGVSPVPLRRDASETSTNRGNALGRGESSPQPEMGTAHFLVFEPFPYPRTGARSPSGNFRGGCRGCIPLDQTQYDMMKEGTEHFEFEFRSFLFKETCPSPHRPYQI